MGHTRVLDSSVTLMTLPLSPLVFDVADFFSAEDAESIISEGGQHMERSPVDGAEDGSDYEDPRTSYTAFLNDSALTRDFCRRTVRLTRLPCPACVERLQHVRYEEGQWFRQHEDYFDSMDFLNRNELHWSIIPTPPRLSGEAQYFRWLRWANERVAVLGADVPQAFQPAGKHFPTFSRAYQTTVLKWMIADVSRDDLTCAVNGAGSIGSSRTRTRTLLELLAIFPDVFRVVAGVFAAIAGPAFTYEISDIVKYQEAHRFVTLFMYLNDVEEGGETVFPYSKERLVTDIDRGAMSECSDGLATGTNDLDPKSLHGGCPPKKGVEYGANLFA
ncbi:hypothetical protein H310_09309 [Aphanomyces invadans]|uniref:Prolyl 4-hydroxylase alpha subunit domain-containing protein n=1 Tax=Aphanomyces invadans TaxID=157072 RepID=A0A024TVG0_9STRA|nr:hypothetical protein H310_09309 [Aphanomyces invadans]ETV98008.1 hypothetical protein H310_09309 [Aphanomyces invadans]|eukprot:XP_008873569.1 hypothetical protein H310_09309 [Aphanomyces invadans]